MKAGVLDFLTKPWDGSEMDAYADDLTAVVAALDLKGAIAA